MSKNRTPLIAKKLSLVVLTLLIPGGVILLKVGKGSAPVLAESDQGRDLATEVD